MKASSRIGRGWARQCGAVVLGVGVVAAGSMAVAPVAAADIVIGTCTIVDNPTPATHTVCPNADLSGQDLSGLDLSYAELAGASFVASSLNSANLTDADLTGALIGIDVGTTDLDNADVTDAIFTNTAVSPGNQNVAADPGGTATVTWNDPTQDHGWGLTLGPCAPASGSVFSVGTTPVTCGVSSGAGGPGTLTFDVAVDPFGDAPTISGTPPAGTVGAAYNFAFTVAGTPVPTVTTTDPLPAGLTLSAAGVLAGTPTAEGSFPIAITASNGVVPDATTNVTIEISPASSGSLEGLFGS
ncbi:pentapeptide repeat-containing protein [Rhodococcus sp. NPDC058514]|uniref:pentapeptide repeat-containing protein n=1 Tax=unclassified Rhodococcus (in: high G+C Gram-positive bacteria) TaxID=192944 RepID=UPI00364D0864